MAYPVSTSIHLYFDEALTLNEQIEKHTAARFVHDVGVELVSLIKNGKVFDN